MDGLVRRADGSRRRPLLLIAPTATDIEAALRCFVRLTRPHHKNANRSFLFDAGIDSLQPPVVPAKAERIEIDGCLRAKFRDPRKTICLTAVRPGANDKTLRTSLGFHQFRVVEIGDRSRPRVIPAGKMKDGNVFLCREMIDHADARSSW